MELWHKFLMVQESDAQVLTQESMPKGFEIIPLLGNFFDMVDIWTPDDVVYLADCLFSWETPDKYQIEKHSGYIARIDVCKGWHE